MYPKTVDPSNFGEALDVIEDKASLLRVIGEINKIRKEKKKKEKKKSTK